MILLGHSVKLSTTTAFQQLRVFKWEKVASLPLNFPKSECGACVSKVRCYLHIHFEKRKLECSFTLPVTDLREYFPRDPGVFSSSYSRFSCRFSLGCPFYRDDATGLTMHKAHAAPRP